MVSTFSRMIWVARRFSRAIRMMKKPLVMPVNKAAQVVQITPIPMVTSIIEKPASFRRRRELSDRLIFINVFRSSYPLAIGLPVAGMCRTPELRHRRKLFSHSYLGRKTSLGFARLTALEATREAFTVLNSPKPYEFGT